jgi:hypothetical protein
MSLRDCRGELQAPRFSRDEADVPSINRSASWTIGRVSRTLKIVAH